MPRATTIRNAFTAGLLDESALGRIDLSVYQQGAKAMTNWLPKSLGAARLRGGLNWLIEADSDGAIFPYVFNETQSYLIAVHVGQIDIYQFSGGVLTLATSLTSGVPYTTVAECKAVKISAAGDTIFLYHPSYVTQQLTRTGALTFTRGDYAFEIGSGSSTTQVYQPYYRFADPTITMTLSAASGAGVTITMSADVFQNAGAVTHIGTRFRRKFAANDWREIEITGVTSATVATGTVRGNIVAGAAMGAITATTDWDEPLCSTVRGYPGCGGLHKQRHFIAGFRDRPNGICGTNVGEFFNFFLGTGLDAEGLDYEIFDSEVHEIRAILSHRHLQVYTNTSEYYCPTTGLTPGTFELIRSTPFGCNGVQPAPLDGATIFCQANNRAVREFLYSDTQQNYDSEMVSLLTPELIQTPVAMAVTYGSQANADQLAFFVMDEGNCGVFQSIRSQKVAAWADFTTDGSFVGVANISLAGSSNIIFLVEREVDGNTVYYLEILTDDHILDCAVEETATALVVSNLDHLEGLEVAVIGNNFFLGYYTVAGGEITLSEHAEGIDTVTVGLEYDDELTLTPIVVDVGLGPTLDQKVRVNKITVGYVSTLAMKVHGRDLILRQTNDDHSLAAVAQSGVAKFWPMRGWEYRPEITITKGAPLPCTILYVQARVMI